MILALYLLSAIDSIVTWYTISHGIAVEWNPGVRWLIEKIGLGSAMVTVFGFKVALIDILRHFRHFRRSFEVGLNYVFVFYLGVLIPCWISVIRLYYWP